MMSSGLTAFLVIFGVLLYLCCWIATAIVGAVCLDKEANFSIICILWPVVLPLVMLHVLFNRLFS